MGDNQYGQYGGAGGGGYGSYGSYDQAAAGYGTPGVSAPSGGWGGQSQPGAPYSSYGTNDAQPGYNPQPTGASAPVTAYPQGSSSSGYSAYGNQAYGAGGSGYDNPAPYGGAGAYGGDSSAGGRGGYGADRGERGVGGTGGYGQNAGSRDGFPKGNSKGSSKDAFLTVSSTVVWYSNCRRSIRKSSSKLWYKYFANFFYLVLSFCSIPPLISCNRTHSRGTVSCNKTSPVLRLFCRVGPYAARGTCYIFLKDTVQLGGQNKGPNQE